MCKLNQLYSSTGESKYAEDTVDVLSKASAYLKNCRMTSEGLSIEKAERYLAEVINVIGDGRGKIFIALVVEQLRDDMRCDEAYAAES